MNVVTIKGIKRLGANALCEAPSCHVPARWTITFAGHPSIGHLNLCPKCIDLYLNDLNDPAVTDKQFRGFMVEAWALDHIANAERQTYWRNLLEARAERERQGAA